MNAAAIYYTVVLYYRISTNAFLLNGKAYPFAPALEVPLGATVRLRLINAGAEESHVMHLHGYTFRIVAMDGNPLPSAIEANTIALAPSQTADIVITADHPGKWMFHCHILDHTIKRKCRLPTRRSMEPRSSW